MPVLKQLLTTLAGLLSIVVVLSLGYAGVATVIALTTRLHLDGPTVAFVGLVSLLLGSYRLIPAQTCKNTTR
jgi:hypothetical protein